MLSRTEAGATSGIVSTGCATMISPECPRGGSQEFSRIFTSNQDVGLVSLVGMIFKNAGCLPDDQPWVTRLGPSGAVRTSHDQTAKPCKATINMHH